MVPENRTRTETFTVNVPYTENVTQEYQVQVPVQQTREETYQVYVPYTETATQDYA